MDVVVRVDSLHLDAPTARRKEGSSSQDADGPSEEWKSSPGDLLG